MMTADWHFSCFWACKSWKLKVEDLVHGDDWRGDRESDSDSDVVVLGFGVPDDTCQQTRLPDRHVWLVQREMVSSGRAESDSQISYCMT